MPVTTNPRLGGKVNTPYILAQSGVPVCLAPNGTVATNGIVTLGTALPTTYSGGIWLGLPAGAVSGGSAGLYWAVMSSTTQGQVYTALADTASAFTPYVPSTLTNAVGSNSAYTQVTSEITAANITLPGGALGANGILLTTLATSFPANTNSKTVFVKGAGTPWLSFAQNHPSGQNSLLDFRVSNRGTGRQNSTNWTPYNSISPNADVNTEVDTTVDVSVIITGQLAVATDYLVFENLSLLVQPS